jgi:hypothetical protein
MADRLQSLNDKVNKPMACGTCGGTFFIKLNAERFSNNGYNSAQIKSISANQQPVYVCLCGEPVVIKDTTAGQRADGDRQQLLVSLGLAAEHLKANRVSNIAEGFVSVAEHQNDLLTIEEMKGQIDWLVSVVEQLNTDQPKVTADAAGDPEAGEQAQTGQELETGQTSDQIQGNTVPEDATGAVVATVAAEAPTGEKQTKQPFRTGKPTVKKVS